MKLLKITKVVLLAVSLTAIASYVFAKGDSVEDRIKPVGTLCMSGEPCATVASSSGGDPRDGESVYSTGCLACHATGAGGAPKLGDVADWGARLQARTLEGLYENAIKGYNGMPAKGLCGDCSDDEIKAAVDHIMAGSS